MTKVKSHQIRIKGYKPATRPNPEQCKALRQVIAEIVISRWIKNRKPVTSMEISVEVQSRITQKIEAGTWKFNKWRPGYKSIDRQFRACADKQYYPNSPPRLAAVRAGLYQPNPELGSIFNPINTEPQLIKVSGYIKTDKLEGEWFNAFNEWLSSRDEYYTKEVK